MLLKIFFTLLLANICFSQEAKNEVEEIFHRSNISRIVNGEIMDIEEVPYYVSFFQPPDSTTVSCGGSIIHAKWILSAAHCFYGNDIAYTWKVRSGTTRASRGGVITDVNKIYIYPTYDPSIPNNDFALVELKRALAMNDRTQVIKLPDSSYQIYEGREVLISGHGETQNITHSQELLRGVVLKIANFDDCNTAYENILDSASMICGSTENEKDSCHGDSGGPMENLSDGILVGIVSFGMEDVPCGDEKYPGVYSKVAFARDWIKKTAKV